MIKAKGINKYQVIWSIVTALNIVISMKLHYLEDYMAGPESNYMYKWEVIDVIKLIIITALLYEVSCLFINGLKRKKKTNFNTSVSSRFWNGKKNVQRTSLILILMVWVLFFLVYYPGTTMNDTLYIIENPKKLCMQHPPIYVWYTYVPYYLGNKIGNPNLGIALLSSIQILCFSLELSYINGIIFETLKNKKVCVILALYFSLAPIFPLYALSAIKDTPFTICLLGFLICSYEITLCREQKEKNAKWFILLFIVSFGVVAFRSNGIVILIGTILYMLIMNKKIRYFGRIMLVCVFAISFSLLCEKLARPENTEQYFHEKIGMQIQQVAAVIAKDGVIDPKDEEYLYTILPKEGWKEYAPCCADRIKWHEQFDGSKLNETKKQFISVWARSLPKNVGIYAEAYFLETVGYWAIESRNPVQYYFKDIEENVLGIYQKPLVPSFLYTFVYKLYCNRFTLRYLSGGTAMWILFTFSLWYLAMKDYRRILLLCPTWCIWLTLMLEAPIAFCFRYEFILAVMVPLLFADFVGKAKGRPYE